jgi:hypothetical protein
MCDLNETLSSLAKGLAEKARKLKAQEAESLKNEIMEISADIARVVSSGEVEFTPSQLAEAGVLFNRISRWDSLTKEDRSDLMGIRSWNSHNVGYSYFPKGFNNFLRKAHPYSTAVKAFEAGQMEAEVELIDAVLSAAEVTPVVTSLASDPTVIGRLKLSDQRWLQLPTKSKHRSDELEKLVELKRQEVLEKHRKAKEDAERKFRKEAEAKALEEEAYAAVAKFFYPELDKDDLEEVSRSSLNMAIRERLCEKVPYDRVDEKTPSQDKVPAPAVVGFKRLSKELVKEAKELSKEIWGVKTGKAAIRHVAWGYQPGNGYDYDSPNRWTADFMLSIGNIQGIRFSEVVVHQEQK